MNRLYQQPITQVSFQEIELFQPSFRSVIQNKAVENEIENKIIKFLIYFKFKKNFKK